MVAIVNDGKYNLIKKAFIRYKSDRTVWDLQTSLQARSHCFHLFHTAADVPCDLFEIILIITLYAPSGITVPTGNLYATYTEQSELLPSLKPRFNYIFLTT